MADLPFQKKNFKRNTKITTPHVVRSFLYAKEDPGPYNKLMNSTKSSIIVRLAYKGCKDISGLQVQVTDIQCYLKRITIGRVNACDLCIPDDSRISRYHSAIECTRDGQWSFRDIGSKSGSSLKPNPKDPSSSPRYGSVQPKVLDPKVPYLLQNHDVIMIGRTHQGLAHEITITIRRPEDDLRAKEAELLSLGGEKVASRRLTWRRSLHCNGCMGWGRRHSCSARLSQLQKLILECNQKSIFTAPRPIKTAIQKVLFHRVSGWWPKKPEKSVTFKVPQRYENDTLKQVGELPDHVTSVPKAMYDDEEIENEDSKNEVKFEGESEDSKKEVNFDDKSEDSKNETNFGDKSAIGGGLHFVSDWSSGDDYTTSEEET